MVTICLALALAARGTAQRPAPSPDTLRALATVAGALRDSGGAWGEAIWPGFRPDTIPLVLVLRDRGTLLMNFPGTLPAGFTPLAGLPAAGFQAETDRSAASTGTMLAGRQVAQLVVASLDRTDLLGLAVHEAFHVFERSVAREGRRFGGSEASWLVSRYPAFDVENEAGMALEGRMLQAALAARSATEARRLARGYAAARERRGRALDPQFVDFESMTELNEGLAEYALLRARRLAGDRILQYASVRRLDSLTAAPGLSIRLRFYSTGSGLALLLDRLAGARWKNRLVDENLTLFELIARVSGFRDAEDAALRNAAVAFDLAGLRAQAARAVTALAAQRTRQMDSILARPGVRVELDGTALPGRFIGLCGFDPQNMLQAGNGIVLHTRWLHICGGAAFDGEFHTPVVQGAGNTRLGAVIGEEGSVRLTVRGSPVTLAGLTRLGGAEDVSIESPGLTLRLARTDLARDGPVLRIKLYAP